MAFRFYRPGMISRRSAEFFSQRLGGSAREFLFLTVYVSCFYALALFAANPSRAWRFIFFPRP